MTDSPARWEYRVWTDEAVTLPAGQAERRRDIYLLPRGVTDRTLKLRDGCFDVKELVASREGPKQWQPHSPKAFPVAARDVAEALGFGDGWQAGVALAFATADELQAVLRARDDIAVVVVDKHRVRLQLGGCPGETVRVEACGRALKTSAVESADPDRVARAVAALGWRTRPNESYPRRLFAAAFAG